jgi:hypothetical protein
MMPAYCSRSALIEGNSLPITNRDFAACGGDKDGECFSRNGSSTLQSAWSIAHCLTLLSQCVVLSIGLTACAAFRGAPESIFSTNAAISANQVYLSEDAVMKFNSASDADRGGLTKRQWRDTVINAYIEVIDLRYNDFRQELNAETAALNLGVDLTALGLTAAGAVAGTGAVHALSAASVGVIGAGAAFNKDVYYQKTLPALFAAMDTNRTQALTGIRTSQKNDEVTYPLGIALSDVRAYEAAGSIETAIAKLTAVANQASADADKQLHALFTAQVVDDATQTRKVAINQYVRKLATSNDKATLDAIAGRLNVGTDPNDISKERNNIIVEMDKRVNDKVSMDALSTLLKPITKKDF